VSKAAVTFTITALSATAIAYFAGPAFLSRNLELWELVLVCIGSLVAAFAVMYVRNRRERRRLTDMQDSALW
jgi:membrane protein DedA with SNARE-associated domain